MILIQCYYLVSDDITSFPYLSITFNAFIVCYISKFEYSKTPPTQNFNINIQKKCLKINCSVNISQKAKFQLKTWFKLGQNVKQGKGITVGHVNLLLFGN